ncbi:MAG: hypothetical protein U5K84_08825 [Alkalibacterium sp.]|nr:hypothetical protein [Alkalibacterium sp.]
MRNNLEEKENQRKQEEKAEAEETVSTEEEVEANDSSEETDQTELEKVYKELDETTDRYLRLQAELANIRKRNQRERQDLLKIQFTVTRTETCSCTGQSGACSDDRSGY